MCLLRFDDNGPFIPNKWFSKNLENLLVRNESSAQRYELVIE